MKVSDVNACVDIHMKAFPGFFLTFLGPAFLKELYSAIISDPSGIGIVAERDGQIKGFVIGTEQPSGLYTRLLRQRWWAFCWASVSPLLKKPTILPRLLRAFGKPNEEVGPQHCGTLMSIAVLPEEQGKHVGKQLVIEFLKRAGQRGLLYVNLTTDYQSNDYTNRFYQKLGFEFCRTFVTPEGRQMNEYLFNLKKAEQLHDTIS
jgi:ribosomal protein S18 acetylase RimI-like enzyme